MQKHLQRLWKLFFLSATMLYFGCQADEGIPQTPTTTASQIVNRHIDFKEFSRLFPEPAAKLKQQNERSGSELGRGEVYDAQNDFTILTDNILMFESEGATYITFAISRDNQIFSGLENLVLKSDGLGGFIPVLTQYNITEEEKEKLAQGGKIDDLNQKTVLQPLEGIDFGGIPATGKVTCWNLVIAYCDEDHHEGGIDGHGNSCPAHAEIVVSLGCEDTGGGGETGGPGGSYPGTGNPSNGSGNGGIGYGPGGSPGTGNPGTGNPPLDGTQNPGEGNPGNGSGSGNIKGQVLVTQPLYVPEPVRTIGTFISSLSPAQSSWLNASANSAVKTLIYNFVQMYNFNDYSINFAKWSIDYLKTHPNVTIEQFKNWFMKPSEGKDGDYDASFWENPNLSFPQQNLPTFDDFMMAYPSHLDTTLDEAIEVFTLVGGVPLSIYNANPSKNSNTCAIRLSRALNYSSINIPYITNKTFLGADGKYYFLGAANMIACMEKNFWNSNRK